ncbi:hypothetical protein BDZ97DRAFT_1760510 [Flammula alnicola]|nr:hypothetical protein BDZ97DRAFT_1760510 [Flammula alnicola]
MSNRHSVSFLLNNSGSSTSQSTAPCLLAQPQAEKLLESQRWDNRREDIKVPIERLYMNPEQLAQCKNLYVDGKKITRRTFSSEPDSQSAVKSNLKEGGFDWDAREQLEMKCARQKAQESRSKGPAGRPKSSNESMEPWKRRAPYNFSGCLAHIDITFCERDNSIQRITGYLEHDSQCSQTLMSRVPAIPIHPHVIEVALAQLAEGASVTAVQMKNLEMRKKHAYRGQASFNPLTSNFRYELLQTDFASLYRKFNRKNGVDVTLAPEYNLDNWLNPDHPHFKPELQWAIFYYAARAEQNDRLKVCISTSEMDEAAWKYGHHDQIILDGTFGVCTTRLLLFIVMAVDEESRGVPLALFLFSAPTGTRATHAGYNTAILAELLESWTLHLDSPSCPFRKIHESFCPWVAITDTDTKERAGLLRTWSCIILLLCRFHVRQCWTNKRRALLSSRDGQADGATSFWREHIVGRLRTLEQSLLLTIKHKDAADLIDKENEFLESLVKTTPDAKKFTTGAISYLQYFQANWMDTTIWSSWSQNGRDRAAVVLKRAVDGVLPTTNHLEAFNCILKRKYIPQWQRSGNRLRFDVFIHHLVFKILPVIFAQRRMKREHASWVNTRFSAASGGHVLQAEKRNGNSSKLKGSAGAVLAWFAPETNRDAKARNLFLADRLCQILSGRPYEIWACCAATKADIQDPYHPRYWLTIHPTGSATCSCPDWLNNGGACKHLRALRLAILKPEWIDPTKCNTPLIPFHFPSTPEEASTIHARNHAWYGPHYEMLVTPYSNASVVANHSTTLPAPTATPPIYMNSSQKTPPMLAPPGSDVTLESSCTLTNLTSLQHVAGDSHHLEHANEDENDPSSDEDAESESVEDKLAENRSISMNELNQTRAISGQIERRLEQNISSVLPTLHGISSLLDDQPQLLRQLPGTMSEFRNVLEVITRQISDLSTHDNVLSQPSSSRLTELHLTPHNEQPRNQASSSKHLLPPSPELKQKRKKSYGVL